MNGTERPMRLPGWVSDTRLSIEGEAARYRSMSRGERARILHELCRGAARQLSYREGAERLFDYQDPLPQSTLAALRRLRRR